MSFFINGLNDVLKYAIKMLNPITINATYALAKLQEANIVVTKRALAKTTNTTPFKPKPNT